MKIGLNKCIYKIKGSQKDLYIYGPKDLNTYRYTLLR